MAEMNHRGSYRFSRWLSIAVVAASLCCGFSASASANHSLIFVVDASSRMAPHMDDVKATILSYIEQSEKDDYLAVISFSNMARLLAMKKIVGPSDRKSMEIMLEALMAGGDQADIDRGLERALEEVGTLKRRGDKNVKGIIILSASSLPQERLLENVDKALESLSKLAQKDDWYIQYCFFDGAKDAPIAEFVGNNNGFVYDLDALRQQKGTGVIEELYQITVIPEERCPAAATDVQGAVLRQLAETDDAWSPVKTGDLIEEGTRVNTSQESRTLLTLNHVGAIGLDPAVEMTLDRARRNPVSGKAEIKLGLLTGSIWMNLGQGVALHVYLPGNAAEISGPANLMVHDIPNGMEVISFSPDLRVKTEGSSQNPLVLGANQVIMEKDGQIIPQPLPAEAKQVEEWKSWSKSLLQRVPLATIAFALPEIQFPVAEVTLEPLQPGKVVSREFPVRLVNISQPAKVKIEADFSMPLPQGVSISTGWASGDKPDVRQLQLKIDGTGGFSSKLREEHKGILILAPAPDSPVKFEKVSVPMTVVTKKNLLSVPLIVGLVVVAGAAGFAAVLLFPKKQKTRSRPHRVIGRLIVIEDPTNGRIGSLNLEEISTKSSRLSLVIGRDRGMEIRLKHASVQPSHCLIEAHLLGDHLVTYIEPLASALVKVNNDEITSKSVLEDGARIDIGRFAFQFEDTQFYKKVEVTYAGGRRISGILDVSGMDAEGFKISPMDAVSPSERARVRFSDIRSAVFYRRTVDILAQKPRPQVRQGAMKRVELMFKKGDTISGHIQREYTEGRQRFVELLPLDPNSDIDYTVVEYSTVVEKKTL